MHKIKHLSKLHALYSGIQDQLCNRHTTHYTSIKHKFQSLYKKTLPEYFVAAQGICQFRQLNSQAKWKQSEGSKRDNNGISMAIENGVIIAVARTQPKSNIYINYNKWQQLADTLNDSNLSPLSINNQTHNFTDELILNYKGEIKQDVNISQETQLLSRELTDIYEMAIEDISLNKISGAVLYINSNIADNHFYYREALIYALYVTFLKVNNLLDQYTVQDITEKLLAYYQKKSSPPSKLPALFTSLDRMYRYSKIFSFAYPNILLLSSHSSQLQINSNKFLFAKVPCRTFKKNKNQTTIATYLQQQQLLLTDVQSCTKKLQQVMKQMKNAYQLTQNLSQQPANSILSKFMKLIEGFLIVEQGQYLVLLVPNTYSTELVRKLSKQLKQQQKHPQTSEQDDKHKDILEVQQSKCGRMLGKWSKNKTGNTNQYIFTSFPCVGFAVLDCHEELWFNQ